MSSFYFAIAKENNEEILSKNLFQLCSIRVQLLAIDYIAFKVFVIDFFFLLFSCKVFISISVLWFDSCFGSNLSFENK